PFPEKPDPEPEPRVGRPRPGSGISRLLPAGDIASALAPDSAHHGFGRVGADETVEKPARDTADQRRDPEQPQLGQGPAARKQGGPRAARRVHGGVRHRNADEMDQRETKPDGKRRKADRG